MGNTSTKESRSGGSGHQSTRTSNPTSDLTPSSSHSDRLSGRNRVSRADLGGILGIGSSSGGASRAEPPYERRETKQEREARRLERERIARVKERDRSMRQEHVDGGYLVTLGTYTGPEDFSKQVVRQLQIERKLAPFWRGLNDFDSQWAEHQIIAAARGLPVPPADKTPPDELVPRLPPPSEPSSISAQNTPSQNLTVPTDAASPSASSDPSASNATSPLTSPVSIGPARASSPFKPRGKALAAVLGGGSSRNGSTTEIVPREINLPHDPFVNGQPLEVFLYKDATECPICFLTYPPYLNHTRCCDQPICSECFVQIKRPDPHYPEGHNEDDPDNDPEKTAGMLISEPACCPYCTQPEFGVTYDPPPFRRGLGYAGPPSAIGGMHTAMSSSSSLNSTAISPTPGSPAAATTGRRRNQSLSAHSPNVILTDRVRPDWSTKLQAARAHQARRAAAATALHTAAFLMGASESRPFRVGRFGRRNNGGSGLSPGGGEPSDHPGSGANSPSHLGQDPSHHQPTTTRTLGGNENPGVSGGGGRNANRHSRMDDLEDMMFMEAVRLSLAAEEERKRKAEKEERKEAKKREKEERKAAKAAAKHGQSPYGTGDGRSGPNSASGSSLSLSGLGFGRKRGNSATGNSNNLRAEASVANAVATTSGGEGQSPTTTSAAKDKGKGIDRGSQSPPSPEDDGEGAADSTASSTSASPTSHPSTTTTSGTTTSGPARSLHRPAGPSHLRQMSNASSASSSVPDSQPGSFVPASHLQDPRASGLSLGSRSNASEDGSGGGDQDKDRDPSSSPEPMFNFRSLAEVVGVTLEGENAGRRLSRVEADKAANETEAQSHSAKGEEAKEEDGASREQVENASSDNDNNTKDLPPESLAPATDNSHKSPTPSPEVTITPGTPDLSHDEHEFKQAGHEAMVERVHRVTQ